ncbi:ABC transporter ATP-binding protein [Verminephrobacter sp. Larva24]|nr:ABC transporter ATP-binding protein [Verminephrobacter sp. Larva24]
MSHVSIEAVTRVFDSAGGQRTQALLPVDCTVRDNDFLTILGPSGCGKSTLLRIVAGLEQASSGRVLLDGVPVRGPGAERGMVFQSYTLFPWLSIEQNIRFGLRERGLPEAQQKERAAHFIAQVGLRGFEQHFPRQLSGGMQQRVGLARALAVDPDILLMDEAFSALDPLKRVEMQSLLLDLQREQQRTVLFVSHDLEEALRIGNRIAIMEGGNLVQEGTAHQIITEPANAYVRKFFEGVDTSRYLTAADLLDPRLNGHSWDGGARLSWSTPLPEAMKIVLDRDQPIGVFDASDRLLGCISARSLLDRMSREARHV